MQGFLKKCIPSWPKKKYGKVDETTTESSSVIMEDTTSASTNSCWDELKIAECRAACASRRSRRVEKIKPKNQPNRRKKRLHFHVDSCWFVADKEDEPLLSWAVGPFCHASREQREFLHTVGVEI